MSQLGQNRKSSMGRLSWRPLSFLASATPKAKTSFNIAAGAATESSGCDYSAEVEMCRCEGEGEIKEASAMEYPHWSRFVQMLQHVAHLGVFGRAVSDRQIVAASRDC